MRKFFERVADHILVFAFGMVLGAAVACTTCFSLFLLTNETKEGYANGYEDCKTSIIEAIDCLPKYNLEVNND